MTEILVGEHGTLYLQTVIDLYSRRLLGAAISQHPDAKLACSAINTAITARGGQETIDGVIFHTDRGSADTSDRFTGHCRGLGITQSIVRVGSCFDNAAAEAFFSSLQWEVLPRTEFRSLQHAQAVVLDWCYGFYNHHRRHTHNHMLSPIAFEQQTRLKQLKPTLQETEETTHTHLTKLTPYQFSSGLGTLAPRWSVDPAAGRNQPQPDGPSDATSQPAAQARPRHARPGCPDSIASRTPRSPSSWG